MISVMKTCNSVFSFFSYDCIKLVVWVSLLIFFSTLYISHLYNSNCLLLSAEPNNFSPFFLVHLAFVSWWKLYVFWIYWKEWLNIPLNLIEFILVAKWMVESNTSGKNYFWIILFLPVYRGYMVSVMMSLHSQNSVLH